jgi:glycosyltransferase involved in cell wall biosynthesis
LNIFGRLKTNTIIPVSSIFVIIPCYNESSVIRKTVFEVIEKGYRVVVVDDCSADNSKKELSGLPVYYLRHRVNMGQGAALQTGIEFARKKGAEYFVTFDADGQHDCGDITGMIKKMEDEKSDIVFGSRFLEGAKTNVSVSRSFVLNVARYVNYLVSGILLSDAYNGLRLFNRRAAQVLKLTENKMAHATQIQMLVAKNKLSYSEYPNNIQYNEYSRGKGLRNLDGIKIFFEILLYKIFR